MKPSVFGAYLCFLLLTEQGVLATVDDPPLSPDAEVAQGHLHIHFELRA